MTSSTIVTRTQRVLHYIFVTAMEGGIGYWSICEKYRWSADGGNTEDWDGFHAVISNTEEGWGTGDMLVYQPVSGEEMYVVAEDDMFLVIDKPVIERGLKLYIERVMAQELAFLEGTGECRTYDVGLVVQFLTDLEDGDSDADAADIVVQLGLFGEVVYS